MTKKIKLIQKSDASKEFRAKVAKAVKKVTAQYENKHKVPIKLWKSFKTVESQRVYNDVMEQSLKNQPNTVHPNALLSQKEWETICHNFSCYAAWAVSKNKLKKGDVVIDIDAKGNEIKKRKVA